VTRSRAKAQGPSEGTNVTHFARIKLLVVMSLVMILASLAVAQYRNSVIYAREAVLKGNLFKARDAMDRYYADKDRDLVSKPGFRPR
jgi:Tfp pilus assembly protein PilE